MKKFILSALILVAGIFCANAQFVPGSTVKSFLTNTAVFYVPVASTTNIAAGQKVAVALGGNGFAFSANIGGTNALFTTNVVWRFEYSVDGTNYDNSTYLSITQTPNGVSPVTMVTNIYPDVIGNYRYVRLFSIQNTNAAVAGGLWVTNIVGSVRQ